MLDVMQTWTWYVPSKLVPFRAENALFGEWFKDRGMKKGEGYNARTRNS